MSKKRGTAESGSNEQTNEGSDPVVQQEDNAKRAKLIPPSDTTLQDLPVELLECILVKVVAMEVKGMKLAKSVWKEKADLVISRLKTVCSQWSSILTTISFRTKLHRTLDDTAQKTIRLETLHQSSIQHEIRAMTATKNQVMILTKPRGQDYAINVYDRGNMAEVKAVIPLPATDLVCMAACNVSNCVYVGLRNYSHHNLSVLRISRDVDYQLIVTSPWINDDRLALSTMSVSANGSLIILSVQEGRDPHVVGIYNEDGSLQHEIVVSEEELGEFRYGSVIQKSNGNLVVAYDNERTNCQTKLLDIDLNGSVVRQYQSSLSGDIFVNFVDIYDRIMITDPHKGIELLDSELNPLGMFSQGEGMNISIDDNALRL